MINKIMMLISIIISVFLIIAVNTFWQPCHGAMAMPCERSKNIVCIVLIAVTAANILSLFIRKKLFHIINSVICIVGGVFAVTAPLLGKCQIASMACNMKTFPTLRVGGILLIVIVLVSEALRLFNKLIRSKSHAHTF